MTYYKTCEETGNHGWSYTDPLRNDHGCYWFESPHGESDDQWHQGEWVVPVAEGAIIEINDEAIEGMARRFDRFFSTKYTDEDLREIAADLMRGAAQGEKP